MTIEHHPLQPFLPPNATMLFLGSFPPPRERWSMDFFYPNFINDFWRILGLIHFGDATWFEVAGQGRGQGLGRGRKGFDRERIIAFCEQQGLAFFDTATSVRRLKDNASDAFLEVLEPTDVGALLAQMPLCHRIVTTGGKASEELASIFSAAGTPTEVPPVGGHLDLTAWSRALQWWRMPSTSRAYPLPLARKAACYRQLFEL